MFPPLRRLMALLSVASGTVMIVNAQVKASAPTTAAPAKAAPKATAKAAQPSRSGYTVCKIEGRYVASSGSPTTMEFRSGKVKVTVVDLGTEEVDCWMRDGKIYLRMTGDEEDLAIRVNNDGSLQTSFGNMTKKAN